MSTTAWRSAVALALPLAARAQWTGILGLDFQSDGNKVDQRGMTCPAGYITGLTVRHGRDEADDTDLYDFKLRCGDRWGAWSGMPFKGFKEEKALECPMKMHVTGLEVKQGRREFGDVDTYDFKLQCSGVWQSYMGLTFGGEKLRKSRECATGTMAYGWRAFRGFVKRGDRDYYEFELNCKSAAQSLQALRAMPNVRDLGLSQNVFVWSKFDVATWLGALGLGEHAEGFKHHNLQGDVIFLLLESHLQDIGMKKIGDRLYFMEVLTQLHDAVNSWSKLIGQALTSTRTLPNLQRHGLPLQVVGWSVKEVAIWIEALGLAEWKPNFEQHRIQGASRGASRRHAAGGRHAPPRPPPRATASAPGGGAPLRAGPVPRRPPLRRAQATSCSRSPSLGSSRSESPRSATGCAAARHARGRAAPRPAPPHACGPALRAAGGCERRPRAAGRGSCTRRRRYIIDCLQSLHEEITSWTTAHGGAAADSRMIGQVSSGPVTGLPSGATGVKQQRAAEEQAALQQQQPQQPQIAQAGRSQSAGYGAGAGNVAATYSALAGASYGSSGGASAGSALLKQLLAQGYSMQEVVKLAQSSPQLQAQLFR